MTLSGIRWPRSTNGNFHCLRTWDVQLYCTRPFCHTFFFWSFIFIVTCVLSCLTVLPVDDFHKDTFAIFFFFCLSLRSNMNSSEQKVKYFLNRSSWTYVDKFLNVFFFSSLFVLHTSLNFLLCHICQNASYCQSKHAQEERSKRQSVSPSSLRLKFKTTFLCMLSFSQLSKKFSAADIERPRVPLRRSSFPFRCGCVRKRSGFFFFVCFSQAAIVFSTCYRGCTKLWTTPKMRTSGQKSWRPTLIDCFQSSVLAGRDHDGWESDQRSFDADCCVIQRSTGATSLAPGHVCPKI